MSAAPVYKQTDDVVSTSVLDSDHEIASQPLPERPQKLSRIESLYKNAKENPVTVFFMVLTVAALTRGLGAMVKNDRAQSQLMMRYRVLWQLCAATSLVGVGTYRMYGIDKNTIKYPKVVDKREFETFHSQEKENVVHENESLSKLR